MELSIVTSLYYSAPYLEAFYERIVASAEKITPDFELILVNDGSPDNSIDVALALHNRDARVRIVDLSRNFGQHKALMTGLNYSCGEHVFLIDCDLEVAPEVLNTYYEELHQNNADVVYGIQNSRQGTLVDRIFGYLFYIVFNLMANARIPQNLLTVRMMTRRYVDQLVRHREQYFIIAGLWAITGFKQIAFPTEKKYKGSSSYTFGRKLAQIVYGIAAFSNKPLIFIAYLGLLVTIPAGLIIFYFLLRYMTFGIPVDGWTSLIISIWFLGGLNILVLGIISIYLSVIFIETKNRPYTLIRATHGFQAEQVSSYLEPATHHK